MDAVRNVLIRISTEVKSSIKAPDFDSIKTGHNEVKKAADDLTASVGALEKAMQQEIQTTAQQVKAVRDVLAALPKESEEYKQLAAELTKVIIAREREAAAAAKMTEASDRFKEIALAERLAAHKRAAAAEEVANQEKVIDAGRRAMAQTGAAMAAVLQFGKGIALLSASTEEETQKIMKQIVAIQGFYDVAHGAVMMVTNLAGAWDAVTVAATAAGVAEYVALGPIAVVAALVGANLYLLQKAFDVFQIRSKEALELGKKMAEFSKEQYQKAAEWEDKKASMRDRAKDTMSEHTVRMKTVGSPDQEYANIVRLEEAEKLRADTAREIADRQKQGFGWNERSQELVDRLQEQDARRLSIQGDIVKGKREELKLAEEIVKQANAELETAREKERAAEIALGHLTKGQQSQLKRLNDKVGRGETLTDHELKLLEKLGGNAVRSYTDKERERRGREAGGLDLISNVGGDDLRNKTRQKNDAVTDANSDVDKAQRHLDEQEKKLNQMIDEMGKSADNAFKGIFKLIDHIQAKYAEAFREAERRVRAS